MIVLSDPAEGAMLDTLSSMIDGGSIELFSDDDRKLAVLKLSDPAATVDSGELVFNPIAEEDAALAQGNAAVAAVLDAAGSEVFSCDVGDSNSDAVIRLNTTKIFRGSPVRLTSFRMRF